MSNFRVFFHLFACSALTCIMLLLSWFQDDEYTHIVRFFSSSSGSCFFFCVCVWVHLHSLCQIYVCVCVCVSTCSKSEIKSLHHILSTFVHLLVFSLFLSNFVGKFVVAVAVFVITFNFYGLHVCLPPSNAMRSLPFFCWYSYHQSQAIYL